MNNNRKINLILKESISMKRDTKSIRDLVDISYAVGEAIGVLKGEIRTLFKLSGLTPDKFAERMNVTVEDVNQILCGGGGSERRRYG